MGWFLNWFGTDYYKLLYQHRDEEEAQRFLDVLIRYLTLPPKARILDVGCGQGRHSVYLAEKGFDVTGLDVVEENIEQAKAFETSHLHFIQHDMREPFPLSEADLALNLFTSFGYFESDKDDIQVLQNICHALKKGGLLVLDFFNAAKVAQNLVPFQRIERDDVIFEIRKEIRDKQVIKDITVKDGADLHFQEKVKLLTLEDFKRYFKETGFELEKMFGSYSLEAFREDTSDRLILLAKKVH